MGDRGDGPPQSFEWGDGVSYILPKFELLGITLLTEVSELDLRVAAMKSTQSTWGLPSQVVEFTSHRQQNVFQPPTRKHLKSWLQLVFAIIFLFFPIFKSISWFRDSLRSWCWINKAIKFEPMNSTWYRLLSLLKCRYNLLRHPLHVEQAWAEFV